MPEKELNQEIEFHPEARLELAESAEWYEDKKPGLGDEFINEVDEKLKQILKKGRKRNSLKK